MATDKYEVTEADIELVNRAATTEGVEHARLSAVARVTLALRDENTDLRARLAKLGSAADMKAAAEATLAQVAATSEPEDAKGQKRGGKGKPAGDDAKPSA